MRFSDEHYKRAAIDLAYITEEDDQGYDFASLSCFAPSIDGLELHVWRSWVE